MLLPALDLHPVERDQEILHLGHLLKDSMGAQDLHLQVTLVEAEAVLEPWVEMLLGSLLDKVGQVNLTVIPVLQ